MIATKDRERDELGQLLPVGASEEKSVDYRKSKVPCPKSLIHLKAAWDTLARSAARDPKSAADLIRLAREFGADEVSTPVDVSDAGLYSDLPAGTAELLWLLDVSLSTILVRLDRSLPLSDVEMLIARTCSAVRVTPGDKPSASVTRLSGTTVALIQRLRDQGDIPPNDTGTSPDAEGHGDDTNAGSPGGNV
jgi:hypothetical protein